MVDIQPKTMGNWKNRYKNCYSLGKCQGIISELDNKILAAMWRNNIVGLSAAVFQNNKIIWSQGYGYAELRTCREATPNTVYRIASISKMITATALMQLFDLKSFQLDDDISTYLGYVVRNIKYPTAKITFRQLLTHTSSIVDDGTYNKVVEVTPDLLKQIDIKDFLVPGGKYYSPQNFAGYKPGTAFTYSNLGYGLIGSLIETISGKRFNQYIVDNIFAPLHMDASFDPADIKDWRNFATLYKFNKDEGRFIPSTDDYHGEKPEKKVITAPRGSALGWGPAGGARTNVLDLVKFMFMHMNGGVYEDVRILAKNTADLMHQVQWFGSGLEGLYKQKGLGIHITDNLVPHRRLVGHPGEAEGFVGDAYFEPDTKLGFIFLMNGGIWGSAKPIYEIERDIANILYSQFALETCRPVRNICGKVGNHVLQVNGRRIMLPPPTVIKLPDIVPEMTAADVLNAAIELDESKTTLTFSYCGNRATFKVGCFEILVNNRMFSLFWAPYWDQGHIMVPLQELAKALNVESVSFCSCN